MLASNWIDNLVQVLNSWPPEWLWVNLLVIAFGSILLLHRFFGKAGLYVYIAVAVIGATIHVLKIVKFSIFNEPVALGTILFASVFLCTDILVELYGPKEGRKGVLLGFVAMVLMSMFVIIAVGFRPVDVELMAWGAENHEHMRSLFTPVPAILFASWISFLVSQYYDVWLFNILKRATKGKRLWLRNNLSTCVSALIDNVIFSILAWIVFANNPLPWVVVWKTYILGTYGLRVIVAFLDTPVIYLAKYWCPPKDQA